MKLNPFIQSLHEYKAHYFLVNTQPMLRHITSFSGTEGVVLVSKEKVVGFFDTRYALQVKNECQLDELYLFEDKTQVLQHVANYVNQEKICLDANTTTMLQSLKLETLFNVAGYVDTTLFRVVKTNEEIAIIKEAISLADTIFEETKPRIKAGMSENEVVGLLYQSMVKHEIKHFSFNTIVASGDRSAFPHGVASSKIIEANDIITIDFGIMYKGFCSDMTRTFFLGEANDKLTEIYQVVLKANEHAIQACRPGISGEAIDAVAREVIASAGYGPFFIHGTGHGLGLDIHEEPYVRPGSKTIMEPGMIVTIEPGIYIEGLGGVRIEDVVLITEHGAEVLTKSPKHLK